MRKNFSLGLPPNSLLGCVSYEVSYEKKVAVFYIHKLTKGKEQII